MRASNGLSTLLSDITVTVQQPEPRDLQVVIQTDEANRPSCIPESFVLPENATYFAIFVNAEFYIEASVANGNNLTFTYVTSDEDGNVMQAIDRPCDMTCDQQNSDDSNICRDSIKVSFKLMCKSLKKIKLRYLIMNIHKEYSHVW